ncbi:MAG: hypothetical protein KGI08_07705, partial [Thaumarchaeota archaeon]|nr:hypothetical protein [Nitrososphaerota archaeon]
MSFGILDVVKVEKEDFFLVKADYEVELMIERLIPSHYGNPLRVRIHPENTRLIRMIMKEFPLDIKTDRWSEFEDEIKKKELLAVKLEKLDYNEPDKGHFIGELMDFQKQGLDFLIKTDGNTL